MERIFFDVDTQKDFIHKDGASPVPHAEALIPNLKRLTDYAVKNDITIIGSVDRHFRSDPELIINGGQFPEHCMDGTIGQKKIPETTTKDIVFIKNKEYDKEYLNTIKRHKQIIFEKQAYNVESNRNFFKLMGLMQSKTAFVYGVATDYCVKSAALCLKKLGLEVYLIEDAIEAVNIKPDDGNRALEIMVNADIKMTTAKDVLEEVGDETRL
ncbi:MAG: isochorismatase family protein [Thermodesulfobacteriota bacterium]|nr:isochorismatase family protein [Thermodesulfobacteriota bacterium]